jgi:Holliday junction resolvasome RuvABC endonuclease subunit
VNRRGDCRLLALDLSTHVGWAFFAHGGAVPQLGTWHAPAAEPHNYAARYYAFERWLTGRLRELQPDVVAFEAPILPRNPGKAHAVRLSYGFAASAERLAFVAGIRCIEAYPSTVKVRLAGDGRAKKHQMINAASRLGFIPASEHEADAIGVGLVAFDHIDPPQLEFDVVRA